MEEEVTEDEIKDAKNILEGAFWFNSEHYSKLNDDGKINFLCVMQDIIDSELYRIYMGKNKPLKDEA